MRAAPAAQELPYRNPDLTRGEIGQGDVCRRDGVDRSTPAPRKDRAFVHPVPEGRALQRVGALKDGAEALAPHMHRGHVEIGLHRGRRGVAVADALDTVLVRQPDHQALIEPALKPCLVGRHGYGNDLDPNDFCHCRAPNRACRPAT